MNAETLPLCAAAGEAVYKLIADEDLLGVVTIRDLMWALTQEAGS